jgi:hypothetical protein
LRSILPSLNFKYTLAFSTETFFSPPVTSTVNLLLAGDAVSVVESFCFAPSCVPPFFVSDFALSDCVAFDWALSCARQRASTPGTNGNVVLKAAMKSALSNVRIMAFPA